MAPGSGAAPTEADEAVRGIVTVEDDHAEGGIGDAVLEVFAESRSRPRIVTSPGR